MTARTYAVAGTAFSLLLLAPAVPAQSASAPAEERDAVTMSARLPQSVRPTRQAVLFRFDPKEADYRGRTQIDLELTETASKIQFHAEGIEISDLSLTDPNGTEIPTSGEVGEAARYIVRAERDLEPGPYALSMEFANEFNRNAVGLYRTDFRGDGYAFTQFEADDAREAFPCFDEPAFKIPFEITVEVPTGNTVVGNTPVTSTEQREGWDRVRFAVTKPLPTYLLTIAAGPFDSIEMPDLGVPARIYTPRGQSALAQLAAQTTPPLLRAIEQYFGSPYPYSKLDFIAVPEYWPGAMEHPGAITYADGLLLQDPDRTSLRRRRGMANTIAHELAHQWFGNWVTMEWWDDLWLNESFADWLADKVTDEVYPEFEVGVDSEIDAQRVYATDARATTEPIRKPITSTGNLLQGIGVAYNKGKAVLRTFENWIGPEAFRRGVQDYLRAHAWGNATADDLWAALSAQSDPAAAEALASFVEQSGFPLVTVTIQENGKVHLRQERYRNRGMSSPDQLWQIPVSLKYPLGDGVAEKTVLLADVEQMIQLEETPSWVLPKSGGSSYYRWTIDAETMQRLYDLNPNVLDVKERIDLVANASGLFEAGRMTGDLYLDILASAADDPDPRVVGYLLRQLRGVRDQLVETGSEDDFAVFVRRLLRPTWDRIGSEPREGEEVTITLLRPRIFQWLGREGKDPEIRAAARNYMARYAAVDPDASTSGEPVELSGRLVGEAARTVPPSLLEPVVRVAAAAGDEALFDFYVSRFENATDPGERSLFLVGLAFFDDLELFRRALDLSLEHPAIRSNETMTIAYRADSAEEKQESIYEWFEENYDQISTRIPAIYYALLPRFAGGCSEARLVRAEQFFGEPERQVPGTLAELAKVRERVVGCLDLRREEGASVARYLASRAR